jgi:expansin (peptidoglycan-binding protein)
VLTRPLLIAAFSVAVVLVACGGDDEADGSSSGYDGPATPAGDNSSGGSSGGPGTTTTLSSEMKSGIATFYDYSGTSVVACAFDVTADTNIVAMNDGEYLKSASCGSCLAVSGPKGKITVRVVDRCPGCAKNHIDLSAQAFAKIAEPIKGRVPITYQLVACDVPGNLSYRIKEGSSKFWTAIQVRDHKVPITKVEYKKNGAFVNMVRSDYNYFIDAKGVGDQPSGIAIRITSADGQVVEDTIPKVEPGAVFPGKVQFTVK